MVVKCASRRSNPVVMAAICGGQVKDLAEKRTVTVACSKLFNQPTASYTGDFVLALWAFVDRKLLLCSSGDVATADVEASRTLIHFYGSESLSRDLVAILNCGSQNFQYASACPDRRHACSSSFSVFQIRLLFLEERSVVSRFWHFTGCVWTLLQLRFLKIPCLEVFKKTGVTPRKEMSQRLIRFLSFVDAASTDEDSSRIS